MIDITDMQTEERWQTCQCEFTLCTTVYKTNTGLSDKIETYRLPADQAMSFLQELDNSLPPFAEINQNLYRGYYIVTSLILTDGDHRYTSEMDPLKLAARKIELFISGANFMPKVVG